MCCLSRHVWFYSESVLGASSLFLSQPTTDAVFSTCTLLWNHSEGQVGLRGLLPCVWGELWWSGCHQRFRLFLIWCFCKRQPWPPLPTQAPPWDQVTSVSHNWVFSLVVSQWSPNQTRERVLPAQNPRTGAPYLWLVLLAPQGRCPSMLTSISSESPPRDMGPNVITFIPSIPVDICILLIALVV